MALFIAVSFDLISAIIFSLILFSINEIATFMAFEKPKPSVLQWLFITTPFKPINIAPLCILGSTFFVALLSEFEASK